MSATATAQTVTDSQIAAFADAHKKIALLAIADANGVTVNRRHPNLTIAQAILTAKPELFTSEMPAPEPAKPAEATARKPAKPAPSETPAEDDTARMAAIAAEEGHLTALTGKRDNQARDYAQTTHEMAVTLGNLYVLHPWGETTTPELIDAYVTSHNVFIPGFSFGDADRLTMFTIIYAAGLKPSIKCLMAVSGASESSVNRTKRDIPGARNGNMVEGQNGRADGDDDPGDTTPAVTDKQGKAVAQIAALLPKLDAEHLDAVMRMVMMAVVNAGKPAADDAAE